LTSPPDPDHHALGAAPPISTTFATRPRPRVRLFQYHRDVYTWAWASDEPDANDLVVSGLPIEIDEGCRSVAFLFHLSAPITPQSIDDLVLPLGHFVHFRVKRPSTSWLCSPEQIRRVARAVREAFEACRVFYPNATGWHISTPGRLRSLLPLASSSIQRSHRRCTSTSTDPIPLPPTKKVLYSRRDIYELPPTATRPTDSSL
jgi:hypothetical protein